MKRPYYEAVDVQPGSRQRWKFQGYIEDPRVDAFLSDVLAVCKRHGMAISHEDSQGGFEIVPLIEGDTGWLNAASSEVPGVPGTPIYEGVNATSPERQVSDRPPHTVRDIVRAGFGPALAERIIAALQYDAPVNCWRAVLNSGSFSISINHTTGDVQTAGRL